jgi:hypothetical protein
VSSGAQCTIPEELRRFQASNAMELAEVEVHGWARVCGTEDPDY